MPAQLLTFSDVGYRRRPDGGIYYKSACCEYAVYHSDFVYGVKVDQEIWLAIFYGQGDTVGRVIGRKRGRGTAEAVCRKHRRERAREAKAAALLPSPVRSARGKRRKLVATVATTSQPQPTKQGELF